MKTFVPPIIRLVIPLIGILVFICLYIVAAEFYPGGSNAEKAHIGFDWVNNYWCDLIARYAKNGMPNPGRNIALTAMIILFSSLALFWFSLPAFLREARSIRIFVGYAGVVSMSILIFIFTPFHDILIFIGGALSGIPIIATIWGLYTHDWKKLFVLGLICLILILLNFFIYLTGWSIRFLPLIQKITLVFFLIWIFLICCNCILIRRSRKRSLEHELQGLHSRGTQTDEQL